MDDETHIAEKEAGRIEGYDSVISSFYLVRNIVNVREITIEPIFGPEECYLFQVVFEFKSVSTIHEKQLAWSMLERDGFQSA